MKKFNFIVLFLVIGLMFPLTVFASVPVGYVLIGFTAYDLKYANDSANEDKIRQAVIKSLGRIYIKDFQGNWMYNNNNQPVTISEKGKINENSIEIYDENSEKIKKISDVIDMKSNDITKIVICNGLNGKKITVSDKDKIKEITDYFESINIKRSSSQVLGSGYPYAINIYTGENTSSLISLLSSIININEIDYDIMDGAKIDGDTGILQNYTKLTK